MSIELFGPLIEGSIVGGLTALLLGYEHSKLNNYPDNDLPGFMESIDNLKKQKGIQKGDPFLGSAYVFLITEIILGIIYFIQLFFSNVEWLISIAYISFLVAVILLIKNVPEIKNMNRKKQLKK